MHTKIIPGRWGWHLGLGLVLLSSQVAHADISGKVFRDFNANGTYDNNSSFQEVGLSGITIKAFDANDPPGTPTSTAISTTNGSYTLTGLANGADYRLEFSWSESWLMPSAAGGTSVQFAKDGAVNVDFALMNPVDYSQQAPDLVTTMSVLGPTDAATASGKDFRGLSNLVKFPYTGEGYPGSVGYIAPTVLAKHKDIGSTFGLAYDRNTGSVFAGAFYKRASGFGPGGPGAIYRISQGGAISIQATIPNVGSTAHNFSASAPYDQYDYDKNAETGPGKESLGDIDISPDGQWLYVVNLFDRHLYQVSTTTANQVTDLGAITRPADCVSDPDFRPFALAFNDANELYVGAVCSNESGLEPGGQPAALVLKRETTGSFSRAFGFGLQFGDVYNNPANPFWASWANGENPLFSDLFFYGKDMVMGFRNVGYDRSYVPSAAIPSLGEVLKACWTGTDWQLENNAVCGGVTGALPNFNATNPRQTDSGPGGGNFFNFTDNYNEQGFHGGLVHVPGHTSFLHTSSDPYQVVSGGTFRINILTGQKSQPYEVYHGSATNSFNSNLTPAIDGYFGKSNGMGDIEVLSDPAPLEIGNRVWLDSDGDGIQDAGEAGIPNVEVKLLAADGSTVLATATTAADGTYYFSSAQGTSTASTIYGVSALQPATAYTLNFPTMVTISGTAYTLTTAVVGSNREIDSNASSIGAVPITTLDIPVAGANNHSFDVGYKEVLPYTNDYCVTPVGSTGLLDLGDMPTSLVGAGSFSYPGRILPGFGTVDVTVDMTGGEHNANTGVIDPGGAKQQSWLDENLPSSGAAIFTMPNSGGTATVTYNFNQPTGNVDLLILDVDSQDTVTITAKDGNGTTITDFSGWRYRSGDMSVWANPNPVAAAPVWDATTATLTSPINLNDNRSFGLLTPDTLVTQIVVTFKAPAVSGQHVYSILNTTDVGRDGDTSCSVDVALTKSVDPAVAKRGDTVVYTLTVTNTGPNTATGVKVTDKLPDGLTFVSHDGASPAVYDAITGEWNVGTVEVGAANAITLKITATVN